MKEVELRGVNVCEAGIYLEQKGLNGGNERRKPRLTPFHFQQSDRTSIYVREAHPA